MGQTLDRAPIRTVCYINGHTRLERKKQLDSCLTWAARYCGERWLDAPSIESNVDNSIGAVENRRPGTSIQLEEQNLDGPLSRVLICHDRNGSTDGLAGVMQGLSKEEQLMDLVVPSVDHLVSRDVGLNRVRELVGSGTRLHFVDAGVTVQPCVGITDATERALNALSIVPPASIVADDASTYEHTGGRPPLGFEAQDGELVPGDEYEKVCQVLQEVRNGVRSKRSAADELRCARATIGNALDRPDMYGLSIDN